MSLQSIPISGLNPDSVVVSSDFIPIVQSSSLTTFRVPLSVLANWISSSVDASSSFSSVSASYAYSGSWAFMSISSSYLIYPNLSTASYAISSSYTISASWASSPASSSWASRSIWSLSSSFASRSIWSLSSSWASQSISSSWSPFIPSVSASYAFNSLSSSYSATASYTPPSANMIRAFGTILMAQANKYDTILISSASYNIKSAVYLGNNNASNILPDNNWSSPLGVNTLHTHLPGNAICITFNNPMPTKYYTVVNTYNGYEPYGYEGINTYISPVGQTINGYTMSFSGGDNSSTEGKFLTNFMVLHP